MDEAAWVRSLQPPRLLSLFLEEKTKACAPINSKNIPPSVRRFADPLSVNLFSLLLVFIINRSTPK